MIEHNRSEFVKMNLTKWHDRGYKGKGSTIVVLDSNHKPYEHTQVIDPFNNNIDKVGHKSHVAQVIREIAPEATIIVFSWFKDQKQEIVNWIKKNEKNITAVNCSFNSRVNTEVFELLADVDIPIFISSGNDTKDSLPVTAKYDWAITVGAWEEYRDNRARYSNYGEELDIVAYTNIYIHTDGTNYLMFNGTSCAAPVASGLFAVYSGWYTQHGLPKLNRKEAYEFVANNVIDKLNIGFDIESGHGLFVLPNAMTLPEIEPPVVEEPIKEEDTVTEFTDMKTHWAKPYVDFVTAKGLMTGYQDGSFQPNKPMTRAEVATVIARLAGYVEKK